MKHLVCLIAVLVLLSPLTGCQTEQTSQAVTMAMGFVPNVQFTPVYVALERGYFAEQGLDIELDYGTETDLLQRLAAGDVQFAIASGDQVALARAAGLRVRMVANWYRRFPVCVVSLAESGISSPNDLIGKIVGIPVLEGASYIGWQAFMREVGLTPEQVNLQPIGYTQVASLTEKRVDAAVSYAMNEPVQLVQSGYETNVFYLDTFTHLVSNGLIAADSLIDADPELVRRVAGALIRGIEDTLADPDAAFEITRKQIPEMDDTTAVLQRAVLDECLHFWRADRLGYNEPEDWEESVRILAELGLLSAEISPEDLYTNDMLAP
ncbi:MAG: ABC transporter substrate-binding protein [Chloroflexi bacterium]|nr:ABC transporter substrate-binding protein [Chloroflexota bacterium]